MTEAHSGGIFVSYRREETRHFAGRLSDHLAGHFGEDQVFIDVETIGPGVDFAAEISRAVAVCKVLLAVIGPYWLTVIDGQGRRRLDDPDDFVRLEIEAALAENVLIIPILVDDAAMPRRKELPESLADLVRFNALVIRHDSFRHDVERLFAAVGRALAAVPGTVGSPAVPDGRGVWSAQDALGQVIGPGRAPARTNAARVAGLLAQAERIAISIPSNPARVSALADAARALAPIDPVRAATLLAEAERIANSIDESGKVAALSRVAMALAATDPDRAERIAHSITSHSARASTLGGLAKALAATYPDRAVRLAESIGYDVTQAWALCGVATALAGTDPDRAESIANRIAPGEAAHESALRAVASALAATHPDRAERMADSLEDESEKAPALADVAIAVAAADPHRATRLLTRAEQVANSATDQAVKIAALAGLAVAVAAVDPDRAGRIADSIPAGFLKTSALGGIAQAMAAADPDRSEHMANSTDEVWKGLVLRGVAQTLAATDPDRAERIAYSISDESVKVSALANIAQALAASSAKDRCLRAPRSLS